MVIEVDAVVRSWTYEVADCFFCETPAGIAAILDNDEVMSAILSDCAWIVDQ